VPPARTTAKRRGVGQGAGSGDIIGSHQALPVLVVAKRGKGDCGRFTSCVLAFARSATGVVVCLLFSLSDSPPAAEAGLNRQTRGAFAHTCTQDCRRTAWCGYTRDRSACKALQCPPLDPSAGKTGQRELQFAPTRRVVSHSMPVPF
jgi:hypothetical protein